MAKKEKRISINALEKIYKEQCPETITKEWNGIEVTIKPTLSVNEVLAFVHDVVDSSFLEDGTYVPEVTMFFIRSNVLERYANFTLPENLEKRYELVCGTEAFEFVHSNINNTQFMEIVEAIDSKIEYMCNSDVAALHAKFNDVMGAFSNVSDQVNNLVNEFSSVFSDLNDKTASLVEKLDPESMQRIAEAFGYKEPAENKVVNISDIKDVKPAQDENNDDQ